MTTTLISGSLGYISSNLKKHFKDPLLYDIKESSSGWLLGYKTIDVVYHLGALPGIKSCADYPWDAIKYNIIETERLLNTVGGAKVVFASSEAASNATSVYGATKLIGEALVLKRGGVVCRISNVYGGDNYLEKKDTVIARLMKGTFEERNQDHVSRDFIHVDEVCRGLIEASTKPSGVYSLNTGVRTPLKDLKEMAKSPRFPEQLKHEYKLTRLL